MKKRKDEKSPKRREFLKAAGGAALAAGVLPGILSAAPQSKSAVKLGRPIAPRITKNLVTKDGLSDVTTMEVELMGANGAKHVTSGYTKKIETDTDYHIFTVLKTAVYKQATDQKPAGSDIRAISIYAVKGEINGDVRTDKVTMTIIAQEGVHTDSLVIRKPLTDPHQGMSPEQLMDLILKPKIG